ncbi:MAG: hypothetical protein ABJE66_35270 [Deltaproteobacteria bacterium]
MKRKAVTTTPRLVELFPAIEPYREDKLAVSRLHTLPSSRSAD